MSGIIKTYLITLLYHFPALSTDEENQMPPTGKNHYLSHSIREAMIQGLFFRRFNSNLFWYGG